jgi:hypothetical protein
MLTTCIVLCCVVIIYILIAEGFRKNNNLPSLHRNLRSIVHEVHNICEEDDILYWITAGTLLGSYRGGDIIPHDDDVDIVVPTKMIGKLRVAVERRGLRMKEFFIPGLFKISRPGKHGFVDVFCIERDTSGKYWIYTGHWKKMFVKEKFDAEDAFVTPHALGRTQNKDGTIVPVVLRGPTAPHTEAFLATSYGLDWKTPKRYANYHTFIGFLDAPFVGALPVLLSATLLFGLLVYTTVKNRRNEEADNLLIE